MTTTGPFPADPTATVRRGDIDLAVFEAGDPAGAPVVLLHGWPDTHVLWNSVAEDLAANHRLIAFDNRGAGLSTVPVDVAAYRIEELAADVLAVVRAVSPDRPVHVLGHDWGSVIGWELAATVAPGGPVASFTSVSGPNLDFLGAYLRGPFSLDRLRGTVTQGIASAYTVAFQIPGLPNPVLRRLSEHWPRFLARFDGLDPALVHTAPTLRADMVNGLSLYRANIRAHLRRPRPRHVEIPVQVIVAAGDRAVRPVVYAEADRWVSDLSRVDIAAGHWSPMSHPRDLARLTGDFVARVGQPA
ncbi:alpha/beta fold hydrolase [Nocardia arizonensis]|uniref:alpha/beta fold hydrolase n=1 Tax=Nocardia arizonensis TaxID=1141647 RepID=UPI0006D10F42|nr:alpha/beta fold hydrolase [Nocardia arizonensis]